MRCDAMLCRETYAFIVCCVCDAMRSEAKIDGEVDGRTDRQTDRQTCERVDGRRFGENM